MSKYNAVRTNGYASKREAARAAELEMLEGAGVIYDLRKQVKFILIPKDEMGREISYVADFVYHNQEADRVVEDVKGFKTPVYKLKRRMMWRRHGVKIVEF